MTDTATKEARYSLTEAAEVAHVCYATVWRAVKSGELHATRRNPKGRWLVAEADLTKWAFPEGPEPEGP